MNQINESEPNEPKRTKIVRIQLSKLVKGSERHNKQFCGSAKPGDYYDKFMVLSCPPPPPTLISQNRNSKNRSGGYSSSKIT